MQGALGLNDSFSLSQAVSGGLSAGFGAGIGSALGRRLPDAIRGSNWVNAGVSGALNTVGGYVANQIAGVENTFFSWRNVAANAVTAGITVAVAPRLNDTFGIKGLTEASQFGSDLVSGAVGGVVGMHKRRAFGLGGSIDYGQVGVDAFSNAIANQLTGDAGRRASQQLRLEDQKTARQRLSDGMIASTSPASGAAAINPLDTLRATDEFQSAMGKFHKPTMLHSAVIDGILYAADASQNYISKGLGVAFNPGEANALLQYFGLIGIERVGGGVDPASMAIVIPAGISGKNVFGSIMARL